MTLEAVLARIYTDAAERARFLADPRAYALACGLDPQQASALEQIDRAGLALAAQTFTHKRGAADRSAGTRVRLSRWFARVLR